MLEIIGIVLNVNNSKAKNTKAGLILSVIDLVLSIINSILGVVLTYI